MSTDVFDASKGLPSFADSRRQVDIEKAIKEAENAVVAATKHLALIRSFAPHYLLLSAYIPNEYPTLIFKLGSFEEIQQLFSVCSAKVRKKYLSGYVFSPYIKQPVTMVESLPYGAILCLSNNEFIGVELSIQFECLDYNVIAKVPMTLYTDYFVSVTEIKPSMKVEYNRLLNSRKASDADFNRCRMPSFRLHAQIAKNIEYTGGYVTYYVDNDEDVVGFKDFLLYGNPKRSK